MITHREGPARCSVSECDRETSISRWPWPITGCCYMEKKKKRKENLAKISLFWCFSTCEPTCLIHTYVVVRKYIHSYYEQTRKIEMGGARGTNGGRGEVHKGFLLET